MTTVHKSSLVQLRKRKWLPLSIPLLIACLVGVPGVYLYLLTRNLTREDPRDFRQATASTVDDQYLTAIQNQDYAKAYTYWDPSMNTIWTLEWFTHVSQQQDEASGKVTHYTIAPEVQYPDDNTAVVTATVTRSRGATFDVHLTLRQVGSEWKIISSSTHNR